MSLVVVRALHYLPDIEIRGFWGLLMDRTVRSLELPHAVQLMLISDQVEAPLHACAAGPEHVLLPAALKRAGEERSLIAFGT